MIQDMGLHLEFAELYRLPEYTVKLGLAVLLSGALGLERERKGRAAGLRTHILVCLGSTLAIIIADVLADEYLKQNINVWLDKARVAAGIITGVGFLGAGTIINVRSEKRGLTTAAMIWFVATLGIAVGAGYPLIATIATGYALVTIMLFGYLERVLPTREEFALTIRIEDGMEHVDDIRTAIISHGFRVLTSELRITRNGKEMVDMTFEITTRKRHNIQRLIQSLRKHFPEAERILFER